MPPHHHHHVHIRVIILLLCVSVSLTLNSDGLSLLALKAAIDVDPTGILDSWSDSSTTPCEWPGVSCNGNHDRVTQLALPSKGLRGYVPSELGHLTELQFLRLPHNNLTRTIPSTLFNNTNNLLVVDLSHNSLSGPLPPLTNTLLHVDLSSNFLNGTIPETLSSLVSLAGTLNLSHNRFSGGVPASLGDLPVAVSLDLRDNNLTGEIPQVGSLLNQGPTAFSGNPGLCGFPLRNPCREAQKLPDVFPNDNDPENPKPNAIRTGPVREEGIRGGSFAVVVVVLVSGASVVAAVALLSAWVFRRRRRLNSGEGEKGKVVVEGGEVGFGGEEQKGRFVVVDEGFGLELEDLLRASAYVVGKSRSGIVYKVVGVGKGSVAASSATVVAVRRLSEGDGDAALRFKEFEYEVEAIGRVRHPNVVPLRAYYYASDEKLLITDFIRNGSLHTALHGIITLLTLQNFLIQFAIY